MLLTNKFEIHNGAIRKSLRQIGNQKDIPKRLRF